MGYTSYKRAAWRRVERSISAGLTAAASIPAAKIRERLLAGYTSGAFVTPYVALTVTQTLPERDRRGLWSVLIGTDVLYALYWEVGHFNIFARKYLRVPIWVPTLIDTRDEQRTAFFRAYRLAWSSGIGPTGPGGPVGAAA